MASSRCCGFVAIIGCVDWHERETADMLKSIHDNTVVFANRLCQTTLAYFFALIAVIVSFLMIMITDVFG